MNLDVRQLVRIGRRWWWLIALIVLIAAGIGYGTSVRRQPLYAATTTLVVRPVQSTGALDYDALQSSGTLVESYRQLVATWPVLDPVVKQLRLPYGWEGLQEKVTASAQPQTQLIEITISDPDPERAAQIANVIATSFVTYVGETTTQLSDPLRATLDEQLRTTQAQLDELSQQIAVLESSPNVNDPATQAQLAPLGTRLTQLQQTYFQLQETERQMALAAAAAQTQVGVATPATVPTDPYAPRILLATLIAAVIGIMIATAVVALLEYRNDTVKPDTDFAALTGGSLLSSIARVPGLSDGRAPLIMDTRPTSHAAEAIRLLRINLAFVAATEDTAAIAISSPGPGEGKSTITANLGVAMAEAGLLTIVIDADLHRPRQHGIFGVANDQGLTTLLTRPELAWLTVATEVLPPNLILIPSGPLPPNPAALLSLDCLGRLLDTMRAAADTILIDCPPLLALSDPLITATKTDGVLLVCRSEQTRREALRQAAATLDQGGVRTLGVVLNDLTDRRGQPYAGYADYVRPAEAAGTTVDRSSEPAARRLGTEPLAAAGALAQYPDG